jgi:hypothetical protein
VRRADKLITFMCRLSRNLGASPFWNPEGPEHEFLSFYVLFAAIKNILCYITLCQIAKSRGV